MGRGLPTDRVHKPLTTLAPSGTLVSMEVLLVLDFSSLQKAVDALDRAHQVATDPHVAAALGPDALALLKAGVIQHFEFTYELCWKMMKRWLETNVTPGLTVGIPRRHLFRLAAQEGLIDDIESWMRHHEARNLSSHLYDDKLSEDVYLASFPFAEDAKKLLARLEVHND